MDIVDTATRSRMMSGIRSSNTKPEIAVRRSLHAAGLRYRLHVRTLPGSPDVVLPRYRTVVFVHGCFWHQHQGCRYATTPASNLEKWRLKFEQNRTRDIRNLDALREAGWRVLVVWECGVRMFAKTGELATLAEEIRHGTRELVEWPAIPPRPSDADATAIQPPPISSPVALRT
jgi:DNA mismatch endonuclease, patch repair protein